jgi:hypothetical protein
MQFGLHDAAGGNEEQRPLIYRRWRDDWVRKGMPWRGGGEEAPVDWDPKEQLRILGVSADDVV